MPLAPYLWQYRHLRVFDSIRPRQRQLFIRLTLSRGTTCSTGFTCAENMGPDGRRYRRGRSLGWVAQYHRGDFVIVSVVISTGNGYCNSLKVVVTGVAASTVFSWVVLTPLTPDRRKKSELMTRICVAGTLPTVSLLAGAKTSD